MEEKYKTGNFICELRREKKISQTQLGNLVGVTNKAVSKWENGDNKPEVGMLYKIASVFGVSVDELVKGERKEAISEAALEKENRLLAERLSYIEKEKRSGALKYFECLIYLLTIVMLFFLFLYFSYSPIMSFATNVKALDVFVGIVTFVSIPLGLASLVSGTYLLARLIKNADPVLIILLLCFFPLTVAFVLASGFVFLIPSLVSSYRLAFPEGVKKDIGPHGKKLFKIFLFLEGAFFFIAFSLILVVFFVNGSPSFWNTIIDFALFLAIAVSTIVLSLAVNRKAPREKVR